MENITNQQVGERIAKVRGAMKMTQAELASEMSARLGREFRPLTVTRLEGGKRPIGVDELVAAADALHVDPENLLVDGSLPIGAAIVLGAHRTLLRAINQLENAVRQYDSAQSKLHEALEENGEYLDRLPGFTRIAIGAMRRVTAEYIIEKGRETRSGQDDSDA